MKLSEKELQEMANIFKFKALRGRYDVLEEYFDIEEGDTVFDCGSFYGDMSIYFSKKVGATGQVYSFEPLGFNLKQLMIILIKLNLTNVKPLRIALGDKKGKTKFYLSDYSNAGSILKEFRKVTDRYVDINVDTVDNIVNKFKISKLDFLWANIEGAEVKMLKGAENTLRNNDMKLMISTHRINDEYSTTDDVIKILESYNYKCGLVKNHPYWVYGEKK